MTVLWYPTPKGVFIIYTRGWYRSETNRKEKKAATHPFDQPFFPYPTIAWLEFLVYPTQFQNYVSILHIYMYIIIQARPL
jgi:hypothetical protein